MLPLGFSVLFPVICTLVTLHLNTDGALGLGKHKYSLFDDGLHYALEFSNKPTDDAEREQLAVTLEKLYQVSMGPSQPTTGLRGPLPNREPPADTPSSATAGREWATPARSRPLAGAPGMLCSLAPAVCLFVPDAGQYQCHRRRAR